MPQHVTYMFLSVEMIGIPHKIALHYWFIVQFCDKPETAHRSHRIT